MKWFKWCHFRLRSVLCLQILRPKWSNRFQQENLSIMACCQLNWTRINTPFLSSLSCLTNFELHYRSKSFFLAVEVVLKRKIIWCLKDQPTYVIRMLFIEHELPSFTGWLIRYIYKIWFWHIKSHENSLITRAAENNVFWVKQIVL